METITLNMTPSASLTTCHASQYDIGRQVRFNLVNGADNFVLSGGETVTLKIRRADGVFVENQVPNTSSNYVIWTSVAGECDAAGISECELSVTDGGDLLGSANFWMEVEADAYDGDKIRTVSVGPVDVCTFETNLPEPLPFIKCNIEAVQEGSGAPYPGGGGKNKLEIPDFPATVYHGVTFSCTNGVVNANGTADSDLIYVIKPSSGYVTVDNIFDVKPDVQYTLNGCSGGMYNYTYWLQLLISGSGAEPYSGNGDSSPFSFTAAQIASQQRQFAIRIKNGIQMDNVKFYPMIRLASEADGTFAPYANIRPITGFSTLNLSAYGVNFFDKSTVNHGYLINGAGNYVSYPDNNVSDYTPVVEGVEYYLYGLTKHPNTNQDNYELFDANKTKIGFANVKTWEYPFVMPAGVKYVRYTVHDDDINTAQFSTTENAAYHDFTGTTSEIALGRTVYGGKLDLTTGVLTVTHVSFDMGDVYWAREEDTQAPGIYYFRYLTSPLAKQGSICKCSCYETYTGSNAIPDLNLKVSGAGQYVFIRARDDNYTDGATFKAAVTGQRVVYELATPVTYQITPTQVRALTGQENNVFADTGTTELKYLDTEA